MSFADSTKVYEKTSLTHPVSEVSRVGMTGFEPATSWSQTRRSSQAELHPEESDSLGAAPRNVNKVRQTSFECGVASFHDRAGQDFGVTTTPRPSCRQSSCSDELFDHSPSVFWLAVSSNPCVDPVFHLNISLSLEITGFLKKANNVMRVKIHTTGSPFFTDREF